jgi:hypothetical protein
MNKYQKNKTSKLPVKSITALHHDLFGKLQQIGQDNHSSIQYSDQLFSEFEEYSVPSSH